ncbi:hypothetical protein DJ82_05130 [Halorubrum sp. Ib24]|uniref:DUF7310 family coiled-coil domain-containing protein n=1 Tax=unclassified Halorubrum TaxID=2642239 RepID=UPI000B985A8E|nr:MULTISPECIES: hypothetical protein [unclassified Halorubrum]OYR40469.1 hypothetical protein DJ75_15105 [Halorubrum sp. Eb13]OYR41441.1 hypothetical protein DJ82_05130 [Halorubrum sp. Ib24]OYR46874.1 hypothetical protein DJ81_02105 [Halorubrum sp. Hd13]OYR51564.1 hypothetical protein DJ74_03525 [Halorubrum sp. Ea8]OYR54752.1 hypothetical protein DJ73_04440 [Halorubrum sp. Ea1]
MSNATDERSRTSGRGERPTAEGDETAGAGGPSDGSSGDRLGERLSAVERALTGSDAAVADLGDGAAAAAEREALESRVEELESRVEELEAATQAIRGYVGSIRAVNREVERRADLALARASRGEDAGTETRLQSGGATADAVPSEDALDAAVPSDAADRNGGVGRGDARRSDDADGSWRDEALDRLRESL